MENKLSKKCDEMKLKKKNEKKNKKKLVWTAVDKIHLQ